MARSLATAEVNETEKVEEIQVDESETRKASQMPKPQGYKILIALPEPDEKTDGGIKDRFPTGPFCKKGDWIVMRSYTGTRFTVHGKEFRLINDDSVEAVVEDPRGIVKV